MKPTRARVETPGAGGARLASAEHATGIPALDREQIELKAQLEERHWWYRARRRIVLDAIAALPRGDDARVLDAGCGSGAMLPHLGSVGAVTGVDANPRAVAYASSRDVGPVRLGRIEQLPFPDRSFDLVTALDVLEHVADDRRALAELRRVTAPGGFLIVTVPAYPRLWSPHDDAAGHVRRYRAGELRAKAIGEGWRPTAETGFNLLLLPLAAGARLLARARGGSPRSDLLATPRWLDGALALPLRAEAAAIRRGRRLRAGLSRLVVFENPLESDEAHGR